MRNVWDKKLYRKPKRTFHVQCPFFPENPTVCEIMWKNAAERAGHIWQYGVCAIACWIPKATNAHLEYVILNAFSLRQLSHDLAPVLRYTYSTLRVLFYLGICLQGMRKHKRKSSRIPGRDTNPGPPKHEGNVLITHSQGLCAGKRV